MIHYNLEEKANFIADRRYPAVHYNGIIMVDSARSHYFTHNLEHCQCNIAIAKSEQPWLHFKKKKKI